MAIKCDRSITIRIDKDLYNQLLEETEKNYSISLSSYIRYILKKRKSRTVKNSSSKDIEEVKQKFKAFLESYEHLSID